MALQGTLDTFELPDVLRLLSSTKKSGRLVLRSERGDGSVWLTDGKVVGVSSQGAPDGEPADGLFDMLRAHDGSFEFEPGVKAPDPASPTAVEPMLAAAEQRLAEWREIEQVVPSLHAGVALAGELPAPELTIDAATWRLVATIGAGLTVGELARILGLAEVPVSRLVRDLVVLGLGVVTDAPELVAPSNRGTTPAPLGDDTPAWRGAGYEEVAPAFAADEADAFDVAVADIAGEPLSPVPAPDDDLDGVEPAALADDEADEVARQLAMLSPRAAQAVAAAAAADTDDERDAALEALDEGDEPINRGLLLKFLSSVKS